MKLDNPSVTAIPAISLGNQAATKHLRGSTLLLAGRVIAMTMNFAVQVLIVRYLSKSDYGAFAYVMSLISLGSSITVFGLDKTITRFIPIYQEKGEYQKLFGSIVMMVSTILSIGFFLVILVFGLKGLIGGVLIKDQLAVQLLFLMIVLSPIQAMDSLLIGMLAIFVSPRAIFFRRHLLDPGLRLLVILTLIGIHGNVFWLAAGYVVASALGVTLYTAILVRHLRKQEFSKYFSFKTMKLPAREVFGFSIPLLTANFVYLIRHQLVIVLLQYFRSTIDIAAYRAVQPVGDLNTIVIQSFGILFMPMMARMFARQDQKGIENLYWQSAAWIAVISFPIFLLTFSLAEPLTILLFGERYSQSGKIMAILAFGYYFNAALGFNADTLRIYGKLRLTVINDIIAMFISVGSCLILIPRYGAIGAAVTTCLTLVMYNILNQIGLKSTTNIHLFQWNYSRVYISIVLGTLGLTIFQILVSPPIYIGVGVAGILSLMVLMLNRHVLNIEQTFPELLRFRVVRSLFGTNRNEE